MVSIRRFAFLLSLPAMLPAVLAGASGYNREFTTPVLQSLGSRSLSANTCQTVNIIVPLNVTAPPICITNLDGSQTCTPQTGLVQVNYHLADGVCLCISGGALTDASLLTIGNITAGQGPNVNSTVLAILINSGVYTTNTLTTYIKTIEPSILGDTANTCPYGANTAGVVPNSCSTCSFTCKTGYTQCGNTCTAGACVSGVPAGRRRMFEGRSPASLCGKILTPCLISDGSSAIPIFNGMNFECIDTSSDLESCGGCEFPMTDNPKGQDCTSLPNTAEVSCQNSKCVISTCKRNFQSNGTDCIPSSSLIQQSRTISMELDPQNSLKTPDLPAESQIDLNTVTKTTSKRKTRDFLARLQVDTKSLRAGSRKTDGAKQGAKNSRPKKGRTQLKLTKPRS